MSLRIEKNGHEITTVGEWFRFAPPKRGLRQWVDGRSAKELAKAFLEEGVPAVPRELRALLTSHPGLEMVDLTIAYPEHKIALDRLPGETRNADIAAVGMGRAGKVAMTIEAKADESFGRTIGETLAAASARSNIPRRIAALAQAILGHAGSEIDHLRYQLLHGIAASLIFAGEHAAAAIFIVFEFSGPSCAKENLERNDTDLQLFIEALSPGAPAHTCGNLIGPLTLRGGEFIPSRLPLFMGKAVRKLS